MRGAQCANHGREPRWLQKAAEIGERTRFGKREREGGSSREPVAVPQPGRAVGLPRRRGMGYAVPVRPLDGGADWHIHVLMGDVSYIDVDDVFVRRCGLRGSRRRLGLRRRRGSGCGSRGSACGCGSRGSRGRGGGWLRFPSTAREQPNYESGNCERLPKSWCHNNPDEAHISRGWRSSSTGCGARLAARFVNGAVAIFLWTRFQSGIVWLRMRLVGPILHQPPEYSPARVRSLSLHWSRRA